MQVYIPYQTFVVITGEVSDELKIHHGSFPTFLHFTVRLSTHSITARRRSAATGQKHTRCDSLCIGQLWLRVFGFILVLLSLHNVLQNSVVIRVMVNTPFIHH